MTSQITIRARAELVARVKAASSQNGRSMNDYVTVVLDAATDPSLAGSLAESVRDRLRRADLLLDPTNPANPANAVEAPPRLVDAERLAAARRRAGRGTPLSQLVADSR